MLYDIALSIEYAYDNPAAGGRHVLHLLPRDGVGQRVIAAALEVEPRPDEWSSRSDFFGNRVTDIAFHEAQREVAFRLLARVERLAPTDTLDMTPPLSRLPDELRAVRRIDGWAPHHFTDISPRAAPVAEVTAFARAAARTARSAHQAVRRVGEAVNDAMDFAPGSTTVDTPLADAFDAGRGVCQDFAHIMIAALRGLGIPAGYVSGFLRTLPPEGRPRLAGADAMHAWVRAWCGEEAGWIDYDPTNRVFANEDHVTVAVGRDYSDVAPVRGALRLSGRQKTRHTVDVDPVG